MISAVERFPGAAQHASDALQNRDRPKLSKMHRNCEDPGSAVHRFTLHRVRGTAALLYDTGRASSAASLA